MVLKCLLNSGRVAWLRDSEMRAKYRNPSNTFSSKLCNLEALLLSCIAVWTQGQRREICKFRIEWARLNMTKRIYRRTAPNTSICFLFLRSDFLSADFYVIRLVSKLEIVIVKTECFNGNILKKSTELRTPKIREMGICAT